MITARVSGGSKPLAAAKCLVNKEGPKQSVCIKSVCLDAGWYLRRLVIGTLAEIGSPAPEQRRDGKQ
jgi:hypothetical protein